MNIRPTDMPELRAEMLEFYSHPSVQEIWRAMADAGMFPWPGNGETFLALEMRRLRRELYWVSPDMTALAMAAAPSMPEFTLHEHDLPSLYGFMYFSQPIGTTRSGNLGEVPVTACSWGPVRGTDGSALWLSIYVLSPIGPTPPLFYENETIIPFSEDWEGFVKKGGFLDSVGRVIRATWSLMQQPLAQTTEAEPDRAARKRLRRAGYEPKPVRVIELRRPKHNGGQGDGTREFHHQWIVRGHWRQQWYPKRQVHRPVWIAPHIKGPEGAPLIGGEKVYAWKR